MLRPNICKRREGFDMPINYLLKDGKNKALTMSYDDGNYDGDKRLIGIFNKYGIKGTFHLNGKHYVPGGDLYDKIDELRELYKGHEISMHSFNHPFLERLPKSEVVRELQKDKETLEMLAGYPVRGMSYPSGTYSDEVIEVLDMLDIKYSRTVNSTNCLIFPEKFTEWHPTMHHNGPMNEKLEQMVNSPSKTIRLLYIWGHSYEFNRPETKRTWEEMEAFCKEAGSHKEIWFATNIEIYDYCQAMRRIEVSADRKMFFNPSAMPVWIDCEGETVKLEPGVTRI